MGSGPASGLGAPLLLLALLSAPAAAHLRAPCGSKLPPEAWLSTAELIQYWGYPAEKHQVTTEDGYIIEIHRIPGRHGQFDKPELQGKTPVLMEPGYGATSECMVLRENDELAFMIANADFDVWIGNTRGSFYGKRHVTLSPNDPKFWDFGWHENGKYDLPATIDYILAVTGQPSLLYFGHSMGGNMLYVLLSERPEYNAKVRASFVAAPAVYFYHLRGAFREGKKRLRFLKEPFSGLRLENPFTRAPTPQFCMAPNGLAVHPNCMKLMSQAQGVFHSMKNNSYMPILLRHWPGGTSMRQFMHFAQLIFRNAGFYKYDHGPRRNLIEYGTTYPPPYNLKNVVSPTFLYYSENDFQSHYKDVLRFAADVPGTAGLFMTPAKVFNHLDIMYEPAASELIYKKMIEQMSKYR